MTETPKLPQQGGRREATPKSYPLTACIPCHICTHRDNNNKTIANSNERQDSKIVLMMHLGFFVKSFFWYSFDLGLCNSA